ncbi:hypothetical protein O7614_18810 [Micromonospora sp. WMMD961]|uniref:hypothetical protein n=1 Tax=Micromonospora sp. WMMD961 TaxID=3016100 RepID=UPI002417F624|nr:hypothetical protein [Micromonospora sp. WMMD961]MDG4781708.1 hypothetical protein [Micromonospora sp. WMMD961]
MTDAPDGRPRPTDLWRHRGIRALVVARDGSVRGWRWWARNWDRLVAALQDEAPVGLAAPAPSGPLIEQRTAPRQIVVPAQGYVYSFHIRATFAWSSAVSVRAEVLSWYADYFMPQALQRLTRVAADAARELAPHRAADLERHLQQSLAEQGPWGYKRGDLEVSCEPDVAVRLDEQIRRAVQPQIDRLVDLDCRLEEHLQRARYAEELSRRWLGILDEHLAVAGGDPDLASARQHMLSRQRDAVRWIDELLGQRRRPEAGRFGSPNVAPRQGHPGTGGDVPR